MPNGQDTETDELAIDIIEDESAEDTQDTHKGEGESEVVKVNLETDNQPVDKLSAAEQQAKKQEEVWFQKVISGEKTVEDAPSWLQSRLNKRVESLSKPVDNEEVIKRVLKQEREQEEFETLQSQLPQMSKAKADELNQRFKKLLPAGKVEALKAAMDAMGLSQAVKEAEKRGIAKGRVSLPRVGQPAVKKSEQSAGNVPMSVIQSEKAWNEMVRTGNVPN